MSCNPQQYAMIQGHLGLHLKTNRNVLNEKPKAFLAAKLQCLKRMKLDTAKASDKATVKQYKASCELSLLVATANEDQMFGRAYVQLSFVSAAYILIGTEK
jgi:hypothetical protein